MDIKVINENGRDIAVVSANGILITDVQSALDLMAAVRYEAGCSRIVLDKSLIHEDFFDLKTKLAGEVLQKFINYKVKLAIVGDFSVYSSQSLKAFIYESNRGSDVFFLPDEKLAVEKLGVI